MNNYRGNAMICANCAHKDDRNMCKCRLSKTYNETVFVGDSCRWWRKAKDKSIGINDLYPLIQKVTNSDERGHWYSDLYCKVKPETTRILERYDGKVSTFYDQITGKLWYEIPFAYNPYWEAKTHADV